MKVNVKALFLVLVSSLLIAGTGCDEQTVAGNPDYWANSYFGQTSPYPKGWLNPAKKDYKYSMPWTVTQTNDKGYLFGGLLRTFEESNAMLFKLNSKGVVEKGFVFHDGYKAGDDRQSGVVTNVFDTGDGYAVSGWVSRSASSNVVTGNACMWLMKIDYSGNMLWNTAYGQTSYYEDDQPDAPPYLMTAGIVYSTVQTQDDGFVLAGKQLVKVDAYGDVEWAKMIRSGKIKDLKVTSDDGLIITAHDDAYNTNTIVKTDAFGHTLWSKTFTAGDLKAGFDAVEIMTDHRGYETGYLLGGVMVYDETRSRDCVLLAIDVAGNTLWQKVMNSVDYDPKNMIFSEESISAITQSNDGNYLVGITSEGFESSLNDQDHIVVKIDNSGTVLWEKAYDVFSGRLMQVAPTDKGFVFTGELSGEGDWQSLVVSCDEDGNVPDHGKDLTIRDIAFMIDTPYSMMVDTTGDDIFSDINVVTDALQSTMREVTTERVRR